MPISEGFRPFQARGIKIPIENVGVRLSGRRPGERKLTVLRAAEPEQPRTLLQEMQQYITTRQHLREERTLHPLVEQSYLKSVERSKEFFNRLLPQLSSLERERIIHIDQQNIEDAYRPLQEKGNISLADATYNDLYAIGIDDILQDNVRAVMTKGNTARMLSVFVAYAMDKFSSEKQREILAREEKIHALSNEYPYVSRVTQLTPAETETVQWLLSRIGVPFNAPPEGFSESDAFLLLHMRSATANQQSQWEQEQQPEGKIYQIRRRLKA